MHSSSYSYTYSASNYSNKTHAYTYTYSYVAIASYRYVCMIITGQLAIYRWLLVSKVRQLYTCIHVILTAFDNLKKEFRTIMVEVCTSCRGNTSYGIQTHSKVLVKLQLPDEIKCNSQQLYIQISLVCDFSWNPVFLLRFNTRCCSNGLHAYNICNYSCMHACIYAHFYLFSVCYKRSGSLCRS